MNFLTSKKSECHLSLGNGGFPVEKPADLMGKHEILLRAAHDNDPFALIRLHREREARLVGFGRSTTDTR